MSLLEIKKGNRVCLQSVDWGYNLKKKLQDMGLTPGVMMTVLSAPSFGPMIVEVRGTRLALGRGILAKIQVIPEGL